MEPKDEKKAIEDEILEIADCGLILFMERNTIGGINCELENLKSEEVVERFKDYTLTHFLTLYKIKLLAETRRITKEQANAIIKLFKAKIKVEREINVEVEKEMSNPTSESKQKILLLGFVRDKIDEEIKKTNIVDDDLDLKSILIWLVENKNYSNIPSAKEIEDKLKKLKYE